MCDTPGCHMRGLISPYVPVAMYVSIKGDKTKHKFLARPVKPATCTPVAGPHGAVKGTRDKAFALRKATFDMVEGAGPT